MTRVWLRVKNKNPPKRVSLFVVPDGESPLENTFPLAFYLAIAGDAVRDGSQQL